MTTDSLDARWRGFDDAAYVWIALGIYVGSLVLLGFMAFGIALETLVGCLMGPGSKAAGDWLLGLSWLANPLVWVGMILLGIGMRWRAALGG